MVRSYMTSDPLLIKDSPTLRISQQTTHTLLFMISFRRFRHAAIFLLNRSAGLLVVTESSCPSLHSPFPTVLSITK